MSHDDLMHQLLTERFSRPVREWKPPAGRGAPVAELLDILAHEHADREISIVRDAS